jgi:hypothetical protein
LLAFFTVSSTVNPFYLVQQQVAAKKKTTMAPSVHPYHHSSSSSPSPIHNHNNISVSNSSSLSSSSGDESWRRPGKKFREQLLKQDGSNQIQLNDHCAIEQYYQVADRVSRIFVGMGL